MRPMSAVRRLHFDQLRFAYQTVAYILRTAPPQALTTYRDGPAGWTVVEAVGHLLDCERLYVERARLTVTQDFPVLPFPDQAEDVRKGGYQTRAPNDLLEEWRQVREEYLAFLSTVSDEDWERAGNPVKFPPFTLNDQLFLACWHDQIHIEQITRILTEKFS